MTFTLDPDETLDYSINWAAWLGDDDTIASSVWVVPGGVTKASDTHDDTSTRIWVTDGVIAEGRVTTRYHLINRITTAGGRVKEQALDIDVKEK